MFTKLRNKSIISKIVSITILAFIILLVGVLISTKMNIEDTIEKTISRHGAEVATSISKKIDSDKYEEFLDDKTETKTYFDLREDLNEYRELIGALFLYTVEYDESTKKVHILVDGFPLEGEGEILSDIGSVTSTVTYDLIEPALNGKISYTDVIEDELTGSYVSSFVPIKNSSGKVIGVLGMDIPADVVSTIVGDLTLQSVIDVLILSLILIVLIVLVLYARIRAMLTPLKAVELANSYVADNALIEAEKALSNVTIKNYDEVGNLYLATKKMVDNLKSIVEKVTHGATTVQDVTKELEETVVETKNALNMVQGAVTTLVDNSNSTSEASSESSTVTGEMAIAVTRVAESTSLVAEKSHESLSQANKGFETIEEVIGQVIHLRDTTDDSTKSIEKLTGYLEDIEKVLMAIKGIADQTNLLSLNASIEAARAGEHGKGFAVVAHEVRKLSDESKHAVGEITNLLANINSSSRQVVVSMQQGVVEVNKGLDMANSAGDIFKDLLSKTEEVTSELQEVSAAVEQISASSEEISATLQELSSISKHSSSNAVEVGQLTEKQLSHMEQANSVAYELNGAVEELKGVIATFKV